jgi:hypothetical protein
VPALPAVGTGGNIVYEGGLGPGSRSHKRIRHYLPQDDRVYAAIDPTATIVPMKIILALEAGMPQFIPLSLLTAKACRDALRTASLDRSAKHALQLEGNAITVKAAAFDASKESSLTALEWLDASSRFVELIRRHLTVGDNAEPGGPDAEAMAAMWDSHFRHIQNRPNFAERFELYLEYDIRVRYAYINRPNTFLPSMWHDPLYQAVLEEYYFKQLADRPLVKPSYATTGRSSSAPGHGNSDGAGSTASFRSGSSSGTTRSRDGERKPTARCMYCGSRDHVYRRCPGTGTKLRKAEDGIWRDLEGHTYCISHNGPRPCPRKDTCSHLHACSLCFSGDHAAQSCSL